jgi:hypothetical protein
MHDDARGIDGARCTLMHEECTMHDARGLDGARGNAEPCGDSHSSFQSKVTCETVISLRTKAASRKKTPRPTRPVQEEVLQRTPR